jgi:hypothetical protein
MLQKLPLGLQDFREIIQGHYKYIDKTKYIHSIASRGKFYFLSRPRRFGKSLTVSTLQELYNGSKTLFKGLWIEDKWDWGVIYPVIIVDLSEINTIMGTLEVGLMTQLKEQANSYGITLESNDAASCFRQIIHKLGIGDYKCVVLIDEYDKPITDFITEEVISAQHVKELNSFYGVLKAADQFLHKVVISGVSKYGKVSIFSDLNNVFDDILTLNQLDLK